jgi:hypothetical protein
LNFFDVLIFNISQEENMNLVERVKNILIVPAKEWEVIKEESLSIVDMFTKYAMILAAIPVIAGFIGLVVVGVSYGFGVNVHWPMGATLVWMILTYILSLGGVFLLAYIIDALAPTFGCEKDMIGAVKIAVFSSTAVFVAGILRIIPAITILVWLASLYSLFLLYLGVQKIKNPTNDKLIPYVMVVAVAFIIIFWLMTFIAERISMGSIAGGMGGF